MLEVYHHCDLCGEMFHELNGTLTERYAVCEYCNDRIRALVDEIDVSLGGAKRHEVHDALVLQELAP